MTLPPKVLPGLPPAVPAGRIPNWDTERLQSRVCPVCARGEGTISVTRPDGLNVKQCSGCHALYVSEVPDNSAVKEFYQTYTGFKGTARTRWRPPNALLWFRGLWNRYICILRESGGLKGQRVCEIGCGYGGILELARAHGAHVFGVELDQEARAFLTACKIESSEELPLNSTFDVICMIQLLEHLAEPHAVIRRVSEALVNDGRVLLSIPNGGQVAKVGNTWVGFRVDLEHLNYFDISSVTQLLNQHSLLVECYWEERQPALPRVKAPAATSTLSRVMKRLGDKLSIAIFPRIMNEGSFVLTVLARKVSAKDVQTE